MAETTVEKLRGLVLSAYEMRMMFPDWPVEFVEDYLNLIDNVLIVASDVDLKNAIIKNTTLVTSSPYGVLSDDEEIFYNTNAGDIIAQLPEGIDGTNYRHINVGNNGFRVILTPFGTESLFGDNATEFMIDSEVLITTFETVEGWW